MKKNLLFSVLVLTAFTLTLGLTGCKKRKAFKNEDGQASEDSRTAQSENDAAVSDINNVVGEQALLHGRTSNASNGQTIAGILGTPCGLTLDTNGLYTGTIKLNYNGTTCSNRTRTGSIKLTIVDYSTGKRWKNAGCVMKVEYLNYKITRASDGKSVELNGTQYLTNETGGTWWELLVIKTQNSLATTVTGTDLNVTFDGSKTAVYNINRRFTYTTTNVLTCTGEGIGSKDGLSGLENYGTTRDGDAFTSQVTTPIVWNITCGAWAPIQGEVNIKVEDKEFSLKCLFGVDKNGNSVTVGANQCPYGWKVEWTHKKKTNKKIFGYL